MQPVLEELAPGRWALSVASPDGGAHSRLFDSLEAALLGSAGFALELARALPAAALGGDAFAAWPLLSEQERGAVRAAMAARVPSAAAAGGASAAGAAATGAVGSHARTPPHPLGASGYAGVTLGHRGAWQVGAASQRCTVGRARTCAHEPRTLSPLTVKPAHPLARLHHANPHLTCAQAYYTTTGGSRVYVGCKFATPEEAAQAREAAMAAAGKSHKTPQRRADDAADGDDDGRGQAAAALAPTTQRKPPHAAASSSSAATAAAAAAATTEHADAAGGVLRSHAPHLDDAAFALLMRYAGTFASARRRQRRLAGLPPAPPSPHERSLRLSPATYVGVAAAVAPAAAGDVMSGDAASDGTAPPQPQYEVCRGVPQRGRARRARQPWRRFARQQPTPISLPLPPSPRVLPHPSAQAVFHGRSLGVFPSPGDAARRADVAELLYFGPATAEAAGVLNRAGGAGRKRQRAAADDDGVGGGGSGGGGGSSSAAASDPAGTGVPAATLLDALEASLAPTFRARRRQLRVEAAAAAAAAGGDAAAAAGDVDVDDVAQPLGPTTFVGVHQREEGDDLHLVYDAELGDTGPGGPRVGTYADAVTAARAVDAAVVRALGAGRARAAGLLNLP
jgi:hypothetical protein